MIVAGEFAAGAVITEAEFVRRLEMSRTPVREALQRLVTVGYLRSAPAVGYTLVELSERDVVNVYMARAVLEGLAAESAASVGTRADLARLEDLYEAMEEARTRGDDSELARLNGDFHRTIAEASGNTYVLAMLDDIREVFERFRSTALTRTERRDGSHSEHGELIEALRKREGQLASQLAIQHVHRALEFRLSHVKASNEGAE
jgi:DNA-binding GntR family transcriptional regulator